MVVPAQNIASSAAEFWRRRKGAASVISLLDGVQETKTVNLLQCTSHRLVTQA